MKTKFLFSLSAMIFIVLGVASIGFAASIGSPVMMLNDPEDAILSDPEADLSMVVDEEVTLHIVQPAHGLRINQNETLELSAEVLIDNETLDDADVQWFSDLDGYLGRGSDLPVDGLSTGVHVIEAKAGGLTASIAVGVFAKSWTVIVYMCADNNLESYGIADVNEMEQIGSDANVNILVLLDRITGYDTGNGNWTDTRAFYVTADTNTTVLNSQLLGSWGERAMDDPETLHQWVTYSIQNYPAAHYAVILWNHGSGWPKGERQVTKGVGYDDTSGSGKHMDIWGVRQALRASLTDTGLSKIDVLAYDACLMAMAEVGYETRNEASYFVASEETEPGDGYEYQRWLANLKANPAATGLQVSQYLVSAYYGTSYATLSAADMGQTANLVSAVNSLSTALISAVPSYSKKIATARTKTKKFYDTTYLDLYDFCTNLKAQAVPTAVKTAATNVQTAITSYIKYKGGSATKSYGVSIWFPSAYNATLFASYANNTQWGLDVNWFDFLDTYY